MCLDFNLWKEALINPAKTFKKQKKKANLIEGIKYIGVAGVIAGIITGLAAMFGFAVTGAMLNKVGFNLLGAAVLVGSAILTPIILIIGWLIASGILYVVALILNGKGSYATQTYLISLYAAPLIIVKSVFTLMPVVGLVINFLISLYALYLLTMVLKEAHKFSTGKAVAVWLIPIIVFVVIITVAAVLAIITMASLIGISGITSGILAI